MLCEMEGIETKEGHGQNRGKARLAKNIQVILKSIWLENHNIESNKNSTKMIYSVHRQGRGGGGGGLVRAIVRPGVGVIIFIVEECGPQIILLNLY